MKGSQIILQSIFFILVSVIAGNDVTFSNHEDFDDDNNIETELETENLIHVVERHGHKPRINRNMQTPNQAYQNMSPNWSTYDELQHSLSNEQSTPKQRLFSPHPLGYEDIRNDSDKDIPLTNPRRSEQGWTQLSQWEDHSTTFNGEEREDEIIFPFNNDGFEGALSRSRRDVVIGSGNPSSRSQFGLGGGNYPSNKVENALKTYLQVYFNGVPFEIDVTGPTSSKYETDLIYDEKLVTQNTIIRAFIALSKLTIDNTAVLVVDPKLQFPPDSKFQPVACFLCEKYEVCNQDLTSGKWKCRLSESRMYPFGLDQNDNALPANEEFATIRVDFPENIPFGNQFVSHLYVSINGLISFNRRFASFTPERCPVYDSKRVPILMLAPFWADLEVTTGDKGQVFVHGYVRTARSNNNVMSILNKASMDVRLNSNENNFEATLVIVATWYQLKPYRGDDDERVTFQCVIISNGQSTYVIYLYAQGAMNFNPTLRREVEVCMNNLNLDTSRNNYYNFDKVLGNTNWPGYWFFSLGHISNSRTKCLNWFESNVQKMTEIYFWNLVVPACPCDQFSAIISFRWISSFLQPNCFDSFPMPGVDFGRRCCYRMDGSLAFENRRPYSGNFQTFTPYAWDLANHERNDAAPKRWCCFESNLCMVYYIARPVRTCDPRSVWLALFFGEPHVVTLDLFRYIFNGLGEFRLLEIIGKASDNTTVDLRLQGRTCRAKTANGSLSNATEFCALAMQNTNGTSLRVNIHSSGSYMIIYINDQDFTARFRDSKSFNATVNGIYVQKVNTSLHVSTPDSIGILISLANNLLEFTLEVDRKYMKMGKGLLGNFNGDNTDDMIFPNGTKLANTSKEREIYEFGMAWAVTNQNLFNYAPGENSTTFTDPHFTPIFLDEANKTDVDTAKGICGDNNIPCIYDYLATYNMELALHSKNTIESFEEDEGKISNSPPLINGTLTINVTVNELSTLTMTAKDPDNDNFQYIILSEPGSGFNSTNSSNIFTATYIPTNINPVSIEVVAQDSKGMQSEIAEVAIITCSGCSQNGTCNFDVPRNTISPYFSVASCDCYKPYSGDDCEEDKDGCIDKPCPHGTTCTDISASEEASTNQSFKCSDCPKGFNLDTNNLKCNDTDECFTNTHSCDPNATCTNTYGSHICKCIHGYRSTSSGRCIDINECVENQHRCNQICINTAGSYNCKCHEGFTLDKVLGFNCSKQQNIDPCQNLTNNCSYGCQNVSGAAQCFCKVGLQLAADGFTCEDIDECKENLCSQGCINTDGSYECFCFPGYSLSDDLLACDICSDNEYGVECLSTCNCKGRGESCDNAKGCICESGWQGIDCSDDVDECTTLIRPCPKEQFCINENGTFTCVCPTGYNETYSNGSCFNIDECADPAAHNCSQTCIDNTGSFACSCTSGYNYVDNYCQDIDECALGISGCEHACDNMEGSFNCRCNLGYILAVNRKDCVKDIEPCRDLNISCGYACNSEAFIPVCYCAEGYILGNDNKTCNDINECSLNTHKCMDNCVNTEGSYNCSCPDGSQLLNDKRSCKACDNYHWGPNCDNECACDPVGSSQCNSITGCVCNIGWAGVTCHEDKDECSLNKTMCSGFSICFNTFGSYICQCKTGFQFDSNQTMCIDIDECQEELCEYTCNNTIGSYTCSCAEGFIVNGNRCDDIDECVKPDLNNCDQTCRNTQGGFTCECYEGYILNTTTRHTCYRDLTAQTCGTAANCSESCYVQNGQEICFCKPGYELEANNFTCKNIDECERKPCINGNCTDTDGNYFCTCNIGLKLGIDEITCEACDYWTFGPNCTNTCACNRTTTEKCAATDGTCNCSSGWNGTTCSEDIDECSDSTKNGCRPNTHCENSPGSYRCVCNVGYYPTGSEKCVSCEATNYGQDCLQKCSCIAANTQNCNNVNGSCTCKQGWEGTNCDVDIDECTTIPNYCSAINELCFNLNGSAECRCRSGYNKSSTVCQDINECIDPTYTACEKPRTCNNTDGSFDCLCMGGKLIEFNDVCTDKFQNYQVQISMAYTPSEIIQFERIFHNDTNEFEQFVKIVEESLFKYGKGILSLAFLGVRVVNFYKGSIVANTTVYIDETHSSNPPADAAKLIYQLYKDRKLNINGTIVTLGAISLENYNLRNTDNMCDVYTKLNGTCESGTICDDTSHNVSCIPAASDTLGSRNALIIGLAVGIPLFIIVTIIIAVLCCLYVRRKRRNDQQSSSQSVDNAAPFRTTFPTRASTKGSWGPMQDRYAPDAYSDTGSGNGGLIKTRQTGRSDFQDSAWYDNNGASSYAAPESREASTETAGPTSNFSWEYMFRLLEPHKDFEIQRPYIEATPNPTFVAGGKQEPESPA